MIDWIKTWGLWSSFNTLEDKVLGTISIVIILFIISMLKTLVRPTCYKCGRVSWFWNFSSDVVSGSGPETCESAAVCYRCPIPK